MIKIVSSIHDGRIKAKNILAEMSIAEYLVIGDRILKKNEFQRNKIKRSSTVYSLFRKDLKVGCTFPPIVLALSADKVNSININDITDEELVQYVTPENLIILDGLQRTYNLKEVKDEYDKNGEEEELNKFLTRNIRVEIYIGINKIGILYRMLTLNTGQTPMSTRHQIEILYSDYIDVDLAGIKLYRQIDEKTKKAPGEYQFRDVIEGFNSYLDRDESGIDRENILENIQNLEKLSVENNERDLFKDYITAFDNFINKMNNLTNNWIYDDEESDTLDSVFGKDILHLFNKPQVLSAFGAALGKLKDNGLISSLDNSISKINEINFTSTDVKESMLHFIKTLDKIKKNAKKIGIEQRSYLRYFFIYLLNPSSDSYLSFDKTIDEAYKHYSSFL